MKKFTSVSDVTNVMELVKEGLDCKSEPFPGGIGNNKTLGLVFFNPSLRTLLSSQKAAKDLGMNVIVMTVGKDGWNLEFEDGAVMNGDSQEHIKDAIRVISGYVDILGVRSFASLNEREKDYNDEILGLFERYSSAPIISLESATRHPLQSLADMITIVEQKIIKPKIAVSWAPHPKALPQAVTNSFLEWVKHIDAEVILAHPEGYNLSEEFTDGIRITNSQSEALDGADFVYSKAWSSYENYGQCPPVKEDWTIDEKKMDTTNNGLFMHCLPIRRNVVATDAVIDNSLVYKQAKNREYAAQVVLKNIIKGL